MKWEQPQKQAMMNHIHTIIREFGVLPDVVKGLTPEQQEKLADYTTLLLINAYRNGYRQGNHDAKEEDWERGVLNQSKEEITLSSPLQPLRVADGLVQHGDRAYLIQGRTALKGMILWDEHAREWEIHTRNGTFVIDCTPGLVFLSQEKAIERAMK